MIGGFTLYFAIIFFYLATAGVPSYTASGEYTGLEYDTTMQGVIIYHLFGYLWACNLVLAILQTTIAGTVADWYYSYQGKVQPTSSP